MCKRCQSCWGCESGVIVSATLLLLIAGTHYDNINFVLPVTVLLPRCLDTGYIRCILAIICKMYVTTCSVSLTIGFCNGFNHMILQMQFFHSCCRLTLSKSVVACLQLLLDNLILKLCNIAVPYALSRLNVLIIIIECCMYFEQQIW